MVQSIDELFAGGRWNPDEKFLADLEAYFTREGVIDETMEPATKSSTVGEMATMYREDQMGAFADYLVATLGPETQVDCSPKTFRKILEEMREGTPIGIMHYSVHMGHFYECGPGAVQGHGHSDPTPHNL